MSHKKVLLVGPLPEPITGVSLANRVVKDILQSNAYTVTAINTSFSHFDENLGTFSFKKLWHNLKYNTSAFKVFSHDIIYLTPGQTFFGILKYFIFIAFGSLSRKRIILHIHGNHLSNGYREMSGFKRGIIRSILSKATEGIVLSESLLPNLTPFLDKNKIYVLPNFAEEYLTENVSKDYKELRFVYLSNLMQEKGILEFLQALHILDKKDIAYSARIAGSVTKEMWMLVKPLLLGLKKVDYQGLVLGAEKKELLQWGTVFVLPTYYAMEGQPISILEAMATGNLILTTTQGGISDVIKDGEQGFIVEKQNVDDLVMKMEHLASHPQIIEEISSRNQIYFKENFTMSIFSKKLLKIFAIT